jgi:hypothetical protein
MTRQFACMSPKHANVCIKSGYRESLTATERIQLENVEGENKALVCVC